MGEAKRSPGFAFSMTPKQAERMRKSREDPVTDTANQFERNDSTHLGYDWETVCACMHNTALRLEPKWPEPAQGRPREGWPGKYRHAHIVCATNAGVTCRRPPPRSCLLDSFTDNASRRY